MSFHLWMARRRETEIKRERDGTASAMSAREGQDRETGLEAKPASAVGATSAETPNPSHRSTGE